MKKILFLLSMLLAIPFFSQKIGIIDTKAVLEQIPEYKEAENRLSAQIKTWESEIQTMQKQLDQKKSAFENERVLLVGEQLKMRKQEVEDLEKNLKNTIAARFGEQGEINKMRENLVKPYQDKIYEAIKTVSEKNGLGIVFDKSQTEVLFLQKRSDYTDKVIDLLLGKKIDFVQEIV